MPCVGDPLQYTRGCRCDCDFTVCHHGPALTKMTVGTAALPRPQYSWCLFPAQHCTVASSYICLLPLACQA
eukprot:1148986-Pelagomonas_calceolata.AAC.1